MANKSPRVTEAELAVLQLLWERGRSTIRELTDVLYPGGTVSHYATVKKLLERLEGKGCVRRDRSSAVHEFEAAIGRDDLIGYQLREVAEKLCEGSLAPLLTHLVRRRDLTKQERAALRSLIDELDKPPPRSGR
jgi:BlaI family transcriptional regulator, penicillinase repressor